MNYNEFSQEVSASITAKKAIEDFAAVQTDGGRPLQLGHALHHSRGRLADHELSRL